MSEKTRSAPEEVKLMMELDKQDDRVQQRTIAYIYVTDLEKTVEEIIDTLPRGSMSGFLGALRDRLMAVQYFIECLQDDDELSVLKEDIHRD